MLYKIFSYKHNKDLYTQTPLEFIERMEVIPRIYLLSRSISETWYLDAAETDVFPAMVTFWVVDNKTSNWTWVELASFNTYEETITYARVMSTLLDAEFHH